MYHYAILKRDNGPGFAFCGSDIEGFFEVHEYIAPWKARVIGVFMVPEQNDDLATHIRDEIAGSYPYDGE